jgi:hypothetical protein
MPRAAVVPPAQKSRGGAGQLAVDMIAALRLDLEVHRHKVVAIEALIDKLTIYTDGGDEPVVASISPRRRGRPPSDLSDKLRAKKRESMRVYRARQKATLPVTKPARKRRRKAKAATKAADPVAVASPAPADSQADLREQIEKAETIEAIIELLAAARTLADIAAEKSDRAQYRIGLELRARCERRGGLLIIAMAERGEKVPTSKLGITPVAPRWRDLARLSEERNSASGWRGLRSAAYRLPRSLVDRTRSRFRR